MTPVAMAAFGLGGAASGLTGAWAVRWFSAPRPGVGLLAICAASGAALGLCAAIRLGAPWFAATSILLFGVLLALALTDAATLRLPDLMTLPLIGAGLAAAAVGGGAFWGHLAGALAGWAAIAGLAFVFRRLRGVDGVGMGDAKLLAAAGAWLGWRPLPSVVLLACILTFAWLGVQVMRRGRAAMGRPLPFGAPLAAAFCILWLYGDGAGRPSSVARIHTGKPGWPVSSTITVR